MMGGLYCVHLQRYDQGALKPAEAVLTANENPVGASGKAHAGTPSQPQVYVEGEEMALY